MSKVEVQGTVADGFEAVREKFAAVVAAETASPGRSSRRTCAASR
jgi:hypothetical protein